MLAPCICPLSSGLQWASQEDTVLVGIYVTHGENLS